MALWLRRGSLQGSYYFDLLVIVLCESGSIGHLHHDHGSYLDHGGQVDDDHGGQVDDHQGGSLDQDEVVQVFSGEETVLVLLNFLPKPAMVVYNAYTAESVSFFLACLFVCSFWCLFIITTIFYPVFVITIVVFNPTNHFLVVLNYLSITSWLF